MSMAKVTAANAESVTQKHKQSCMCCLGLFDWVCAPVGERKRPSGTELRAGALGRDGELGRDESLRLRSIMPICRPGGSEMSDRCGSCCSGSRGNGLSFERDEALRESEAGASGVPGSSGDGSIASPRVTVHVGRGHRLLWPRTTSRSKATESSPTPEEPRNERTDPNRCEWLYLL